jgi:hypothetical protein
VHVWLRGLLVLGGAQGRAREKPAQQRHGCQKGQTGTSGLLAGPHGWFSLTAKEPCLQDKQRLALTAELKGMPQDEIARQLGSNRNAVYKLTHDARCRLKAGLEAAGFGADSLGEARAIEEGPSVMNLSDEQIRALLQTISRTRDEELNCDECLTGLGAFAESTLKGRPAEEACDLVRQHLQICGECSEEFMLLLKALEALARP